MNELLKKIRQILDNTLPVNAFRYIGTGKSLNDEYIKIAFAAKDYDINGVQGQKPQIVSLVLYVNKMELHPQIFGGNGGQCIYRIPNKELREEKYLAMASTKIPFKRPKPEEKFVLAAIERFAENWVKALKENRNVLMYQEIVNYDELLK